MEMCLERELEIEDLRKHPQEMIAQLRDLLASGGAAIPDPKRVGFYEVKRLEQIYYIYVSPNTGKVLLIAAWSHEEVFLAGAAVSA
jgi:hypothetical protein